MILRSSLLAAFSLHSVNEISNKTNVVHHRHSTVTTRNMSIVHFKTTRKDDAIHSVYGMSTVYMLSTLTLAGLASGKLTLLPANNKVYIISAVSMRYFFVTPATKE